VIVNTHATFRWRHGLFSAFDFDQIRRFSPTCSSAWSTTSRWCTSGCTEHEIDATLKDCMVWREEEILATELMSQAVPGSKFYIVSRGRQARHGCGRCSASSLRPDMKKVYPSFPMSHVVGMPDVQAEIDQFRDALAEHFITFDPGDVDEKLLLDRAIEAAKEGQDFFDHEVPHSARRRRASKDAPIRMRTRDVLDIAGDIDGQIYMRDFKLIDQSDMIVSLVPELPGRDAGAVERRGARASARVRAHQRGLRGVEAGQAAEPVHHRDRDEGLRASLRFEAAYAALQTHGRLRGAGWSSTSTRPGCSDDPRQFSRPATASAAGPTLPPQGLCLMRIAYD
jgi:hypothetical protein